MTPQLIRSIVDSCNKPTDDSLLDSLYDHYNDDTVPEDLPVYYRFLYYLSKQFPGLNMVEIGCRHGAASLHFLKGGGGFSTMIDPKPQINKDHFSNLPYAVIQDIGESQKALKQVKGDIDILFIDSDHSYNSTKGEFDLWLPKVKPDGLVLFDDIHAYANTGREDFSCGRFWQELQKQFPDKCLDLPELHLGGWGCGVYLK